MKKIKTALAAVIIALVLVGPAWASPQIVTLNVSGMTCAACPITVKKALEKGSRCFNSRSAVRKETGSSDLRRCENQHRCAR